MDEYIKREVLLSDICDDMCGLKYTGVCENCRVVALIADAPAADVAPVVRCKDCKHKGWVQEPCHGKSVDYCKVWDCTLRNLEATFCSYGERKDTPCTTP